jgi:hypothetical protein
MAMFLKPPKKKKSVLACSCRESIHGLEEGGMENGPSDPSLRLKELLFLLKMIIVAASLIDDSLSRYTITQAIACS